MEMAMGTWRVSVQRVPPSGIELARIYDRTAQYWDASLTLLGYRKAYTELFAGLRATGLLNGVVSDGRVLDCGIGTGALSLALMETIGPTVQMSGVDIAPQMIQKARSAFNKAGVAASLYVEDVSALPFASDSFDVVMSAHMLEHLRDYACGLEEMMRVLRSGCPLLIVVTRRGIADTLLRLKWRHGSVRSGSLLDWMTNAGFRDLTIAPLGNPHSLARATSVAVVGIKAAIVVPESSFLVR